MYVLSIFIYLFCFIIFSAILVPSCALKGDTCTTVECSCLLSPFQPDRSELCNACRLTNRITIRNGIWDFVYHPFYFLYSILSINLRKKFTIYFKFLNFFNIIFYFFISLFFYNFLYFLSYLFYLFFFITIFKLSFIYSFLFFFFFCHTHTMLRLARRKCWRKAECMKKNNT